MLFVAFLLCLFLLLSSAEVCMATSEREAASKISEASSAVDSAYEAAFEAERSGANITSLLTILNEAGELLSKANLAYGVGDFDSAFEFANLCQVKLEGFVGEANALKEDAVQQRNWDFIVNVVGSIVGTTVVVCGGFVVWSSLKKKYERAGSMV